MEDVVDIDKFIKTVRDHIENNRKQVIEAVNRSCVISEDKRKRVIETVNRACVISEDMVEKIIDILVEGNR